MSHVWSCCFQAAVEIVVVMLQFCRMELLCGLLYCTAAFKLTWIASYPAAGAPESGGWSDWQIWLQDQRTSWGTDRLLSEICIVVSLLASARCNIYISRLCYDVSVRLYVRLSVTEVHWHIIANLSFKFRSHFTAHCGRAACGWIISRHASQC